MGWRQHFKPNIWTQICSDFFMMILILYKIIQKWLLLLLKPLRVPCFYVLYFIKYAFSFNHVRNINLHKQVSIYLLFILLVLILSSSLYDVKAVPDDIYAKTVPIWLHHTVDHSIPLHCLMCLSVHCSVCGSWEEVQALHAHKFRFRNAVCTLGNGRSSMVECTGSLPDPHLVL